MHYEKMSYNEILDIPTDLRKKYINYVIDIINKENNKQNKQNK